jgi:hypothetical protein
MTDETTKPTTDLPPGADETFGWTGDDQAGSPNGGGSHGGPTSARDWLAQLQAMIENVTEQAAPVLREVSAKAAELAAVAGEKAGPFAARAAELTAEAGTKLAERSRDLAAELRRDQAARAAGAGAAAAPTETPAAAPVVDDEVV